MTKIKPFEFTSPAIILSMLLLMASCMGKNNTPIITKDFKVSNFEVLNVEVVGEVIFEQSSTPYLSAEGNENLINELEISHQNNRLSIISEQEQSFFGDKGKLTLKIGAPTLHEISQKGIGSLKIKGDFNADHLSIIHTGVGNFSINNCKLGELNIASKAVGNCHVSGSANSVFIESNGVGNVDCSDLKAQNAKVVSKGVGNLTVYADEKLDIVVKGVGNVTYLGEPEELITVVSGIGKVKHLK